VCIGVPCQIVEIHDQMAIVEIGGTQREVRLDLLIDEYEARIGDFVIVHAGFAIQKINAQEAEETLQLLKEMME
jgi:hydrogenase expression/formation protein HypC